MLENFTETLFPDNRPILEDVERDSITRGATCTHIFELPFRCTGYVQDLSIIYRQGLDIILIKDFIDCTLTETVSDSIITIKLTPADTLKFEQNLLDVFVQLKVLTINNDTLYNTPIKLVLDPTLDNYPVETEI